MQRSHMLLLIQEILVEQSEAMTLEEAAEDILTRIERIGMLPPAYIRNYMSPTGNQKEFKYNEWESEDV